MAKKNKPSPSSNPLTIIAEVLGQPADQMRNPVNADYLCPFLNSACMKRSHSGHRSDEPYPVCSVWRQREVICVCPKRFYEIELVKDVLANCWLNDSPPAEPRLAHEVQMKGFGNVDFVIAELFDKGGIKNFVSVELQAVDLTGSVYPAYDALINNRDLSSRPRYGINWANVRKRYVEQLVKKGIYHHHWQSRMISVIQSPFFDYLCTNLRFDQLDSKSPSSNIVFMVYDFDLDTSNGTPKHTLELRNVVGTSHSSLMMSALYRKAPPRDEFCRKIESRLAI